MPRIDRRQFVGGAAVLSLIPHGVSAMGQGAPSVDVDTSDGRVRGMRRAGVSVFRGIPYAAPTSGANRFMAPLPVEKWAGVREAFDYGERAPQDSRGAEPAADGSSAAPRYGEDCCVLNVFTPETETATRRPVMIFIHGGGFRGGSGDAPTMDGSPLATFGDVVVVTLNRRLNVLGFANLGVVDPAFADAANAGQLDLVAALRWVRANIAAFGGDPTSVTLFGVSGGGSAIETLLIMPEARGLFHRTINMSGSSAFAMRTADEMAPVTETFLKTLAVDRGDLRRLQALPPEQLRVAYDAASRTHGMGDYRPVVDGRHILDPPLTPRALSVGRGLPGILSCTATEASAWLANDRRNLAVTAGQVQRRVAEQFGLSAQAAAATLAAYRQDDPRRTPWDLLVAVATDALVRTPMRRAAEIRSAAGLSPVHCCEFDWRSPIDGGIWGATHGVDVPFAFGTIGRSRFVPLPDIAARAVQRAEMAAFVSFARSGRPAIACAPAWRPYDARRRATMVIGAPPRLVDDYRAADRGAAAALPQQDAFAIIAGPLFRAAG